MAGGIWWSRWVFGTRGQSSSNGPLPHRIYRNCILRLAFQSLLAPKKQDIPFAISEYTSAGRAADIWACLVKSRVTAVHFSRERYRSCPYLRTRHLKLDSRITSRMQNDGANYRNRPTNRVRPCPGPKLEGQFRPLLSPFSSTTWKYLA